MYAAISPSDPPEPRPASDRQLARADAELRLGLGADAASPITHLYQRSPARALFPRVEAGEPPQAVLLNTAGGLAGGDRWRVDVEVGAGARAVVAGQAAEKLYRALDRETEVSTRLRLGPGAWLEWLPQATILFDGARLRRRLEAELAPGARLLAVETLVFGRHLSGERLTRGSLRDAWRLRRAGRLIWADSLEIEAGMAEALAAPAGFAGARAMATLVYAAEDAGHHLDALRALLPADGGRAGASLLDGLLLCRLLDDDPGRLRLAVGRLVAGFRALAAGLPPRLPKVWGC